MSESATATPGEEAETVGSNAGTLRCRAPGNYDVDATSRVFGLACLDESLAVQEMKDEADINTIVRNFGVTGHLPEVPFPPTYGDFSMAGDYQTALDLIREADASFMALPAEIRYGSFQNDPAAFVAFCDDPANLPQLREWGMAEMPPAAPTEPTGAGPTPATAPADGA